jgi:hypothetical protein
MSTARLGSESVLSTTFLILGLSLPIASSPTCCSASVYLGILDQISPSVTSVTLPLCDRADCGAAHNHREIPMKLIAAGTLALAANIAQPRTALAWGDDGHKVVALITQPSR